MTRHADTTGADTRGPRDLLSKVPQIALAFWVIKVLCTTVGETFADYLNDGLGLGLTLTSIVMTALLLSALILQFRARKYVPWIYWTTVVLISVVGTLLTDTLTDSLGVDLRISTSVFALALVVVFSSWFAVERTLSIHRITTRRRETFYWTTILVTFALGTAVGDLLGEQLGLGYLPSALLFAGAIAAIAVAHRYLRLRAVMAFWAAYILTRPLGASIGDLLSQPAVDGGVGIGPTVTSIVFLTAIAVLVLVMTLRRPHQATPPPARHA